MTAPIAMFGAAIRRAAAGAPATVDVLDQAGVTIALLDAARWSGDLVTGDATMLARCTGPTLDVGCGPGRLVSALHHAGATALGIDLSTEAVRQARRRGAPAIRADVFGPLPQEGHWRTVLLADGNIGIGGDPVRLLYRCKRLLDRVGAVLVELRPPGERGWRGEVVLRHAHRHSTPFPWATVPADRVAILARRCGLRVRDEWRESQRWFAMLGRRR